MNDIKYKCLCMLTEIAQILHDVIVQYGQNRHLVIFFDNL